MNHGPLRRNTCILKANVIQSAVLNRGRGNKFEESTCSSVSCRVSTLKNYKTSTSNASIDIISTMRQLFTYLRQKEDFITASTCMCIKSQQNA